MDVSVSLGQSGSPARDLGSSEEILSTMEERQRRLLEADDSTAEPPASSINNQRGSDISVPVQHSERVPRGN